MQAVRHLIISLGWDIFQDKQEEFRGYNSVGHLGRTTNTSRHQQDEVYTRRC